MRRSVAAHAPAVCAALLLACSGAADETPVPAAASAPRPHQAEPPQTMATVTEVEGDVRVRRTDAAAWVALQPGQPLFPRDTVQTMDDGTAELRFATGTRTSLHPNTTLQLPAAPPRVARLKHLSGRMLARLQRDGSTDRLEVELPPGLLVVHADQDSDQEQLEARVEVGEDRTEIAMLHGRAELNRTEGSVLPIEQSRYVAVSADGALLESGWTGPEVTLAAPTAGATVRTRGAVTFRWAASRGVEAYQLEIAAGQDAAPTAAQTVTGTRAEVELSSGVYTWAVRGIRGGESQQERATRTLTVELDRTPPPLEVFSPRPGESVRGGTIAIRGSTEPGARLTIDGRRVDVGEDGAFRAQQQIQPGLANIVVRVADDLGNTRTVSRTVVRE